MSRRQLGGLSVSVDFLEATECQEGFQHQMEVFACIDRLGLINICLLAEEGISNGYNIGGYMRQHWRLQGRNFNITFYNKRKDPQSSRWGHNNNRSAHIVAPWMVCPIAASGNWRAYLSTSVFGNRRVVFWICVSLVRKRFGRML